MNVATLDMPVEVAHERFLVYRDALRRMPLPQHESDPDREPFKVLMKAHKAVADGKQVIDLSKSIQSAGWDDQGRPRLAVVRATGREVFFQKHAATWHFGMTSDAVANCRPSKYRTVIVKAPGDAPEPHTNRDGWDRSWRAIAPSVPPEHRPTRGGLAPYHLLFEPIWEAVPDPDPMLIRHIAGSLWVVLAVWDLTPIELAVLASE